MQAGGIRRTLHQIFQDAFAFVLLAGRQTSLGDRHGNILRQIAETKIQPAQLATLLTLVDNKVVNPNTGKRVLELMYKSGEDPQTIVEREGLAMVSDTAVIDDAINEIFAANADALARYRGGEEKLFGFFMGQVMRATKGKADPNAAKARLQELIQK